MKRAKNALDKNSGGELLSPVKFSGFRTNTGSIVISTQSDGNGIGDGQTQFGYNVGNDSAPIFNHYLRGQGITNIDTSGGCDIREGLRVGRRVVPGDYGNFDSRYLKLSQNGSDIPNKSAFRAVLELGDAALRTVGNEYANIPSMGYFLASLGYNGWQQIPSQDGAGNLIIQWGTFGGFQSGTGATVKFPRPFPRRCVFAIPVAIVPWETKTTTMEPVYLAEKSAAYATFRKGGTVTIDGLYIALGY
ncbi:hypothetical protein [Xenorhabdus sp. TS4]|uniref:gp53-like domain-containing protein n=1 Tax=Xenorhabdus sp. TS4 TaxID=1873483 RepID=UPI001657264B|nr:hypothetical protein [Xenorhabdus sp. TS4]MBC8949619.1 hypothetical protein [Xenorhabdus sp. TS4]